MVAKVEIRQWLQLLFAEEGATDEIHTGFRLGRHAAPLFEDHIELQLYSSRIYEVREYINHLLLIALGCTTAAFASRW